MPFDVTEADRQMVHYAPLINFKKRNEEMSGSQHLISSKEEEETNNDTDRYQHFETGSKVKYACFKCERHKPECGGTRN